MYGKECFGTCSVGLKRFGSIWLKRIDFVWLKRIGSIWLKRIGSSFACVKNTI